MISSAARWLILAISCSSASACGRLCYALPSMAGSGLHGTNGGPGGGLPPGGVGGGGGGARDRDLLRGWTLPRYRDWLARAITDALC